MSSPTPIITPPPTKPKRFDWTGATKKLSTLVAAVSLSFATISATLLTHYNGLTPEQQATWPFWLPTLLALAPGLIAALGPVAVAFRQAIWGDDTDQAGA